MRKGFLPALALAVSALLSGGPQAAETHNDVRIASPWPAQNTIITMLGYGDNIVGTSMVAKQIPRSRYRLWFRLSAPQRCGSLY
jgi:iron complex transport system substrate-binding protein